MGDYEEAQHVGFGKLIQNNSGVFGYLPMWDL